jgi:HD-GYP domain-containing protein (c-di-GMP phosphodiesterase class II)
MSLKDFRNINLPENLPTQTLPFDLFVYFKNQYLCYRKSESEISKQLVQKLRNQSISQLFCRSEQVKDYFKFINNSMEQICNVNSETTTVQDKLDSIQISTLNSIKYIAENPTDKYAYQMSRKSTAYLMSLLRSHPEVLENVLKNDLKEDTVFLHSKNVASLASCVSRKAGAKKETLEYIALAGLLHDIGISQLDENTKELFYLGNSAGKDTRYREYMKHGKNLELLLSNTDFVPKPVSDLIADHEHTLKTKGNLNLFAQILSMCDKFDKYITVQSLVPNEALNLFKVEFIGCYDLKLFKILSTVLAEGGLLNKESPATDGNSETENLKKAA